MRSPLEDIFESLLSCTAPIEALRERPPGKRRVVFDTECYRNFWCLAIKDVDTGERRYFEFSKREDFDRMRVRRILKQVLSVGFNSLNYDLPMIYLALSGASNEELKEASDRIIVGGLKYWEVERELGIKIPDIDTIDLFEPNPAVRDSLKTLGGRLHVKRMQDLPYPPDTILTEAQMDEVKEYCLVSDLDATHALFTQLKEALDLRVFMGERYGTDFRSKSDAQMGENIVKIMYERETGKRAQKAEVKPGTSFQYDVPDFIKFETPQMQQVLETIRDTRLVVKKGGKVDFPEAFKKFNIKINGKKYKLGIGGLHSMEKSRGVKSSNSHILLTGDVASQYPNIIMKLGLFPKAIGKIFLKIYKSLIDQRLEAKASGNKAVNLGLKISINGIYGKLGSAFSVLFAPHLLIAVTLTGQLTLLMLIEKLESLGIEVVSANTDGIEFYCPRELFNGFVQKGGKDSDRFNPSPLQDVIDWWEKTTSFNMEFAEYAALYSRDVNTYMAIKPDGKAKRKGVIANHWSPDSPDYDPGTYQMKKNPQFSVCGDAALAYITKGIPVEKFITEYRDMRGFIRIINASGGATWRGQYLGKVVRYYWGLDGEAIIKVKPNDHGTHPKVPETDGARPAMMLPDDYSDIPSDIDYARYIEETYQILDEIGYGRPSPTLLELFLRKRVLQVN